MKMNREHVVPMTAQTLVILEVIKPIIGHRAFIFPSSRNPKVPTNTETANKALSRMGFKDRAIAHGVRALASTLLMNRALNLMLLNPHWLIQISKAYNRTDYLETRRKLMSW